MMKNLSLAFLIPAYNEEEGLAATVGEIEKALEGLTVDYEILIIDDSSHDRTAEIGRKLAKDKSGVRYLRNEENRGFSGSYWRAVRECGKESCMYLPGDNDVPASEVRKLVLAAKEFDVVVSYPGNIQERVAWRRILSLSYTKLLNLITGLQFPYYNGFNIYLKKELLKLGRLSDSFSFQAEILMGLESSQFRIGFIPISCRFNDKSSTAFKWRNIVGVCFFIIKTFFKRRLFS